MSSSLGKWALIDIETTGINPVQDSIIDIGFLQFEGTKLVREYSSLVRYEDKLSQFIQKLTGITQEMVTHAPHWDAVEPELLTLFDHDLLAHNATFEETFLDGYFEECKDEYVEMPRYVDSLPFLGLLFPERSSLKLENFIVDFGLAEKELHRGFQDSVDLLKVLLVALVHVKQDPRLKSTLHYLFEKYDYEQYWFRKFFHLTVEELHEIAEQIDFDIEKHLTYFSKNCLQEESYTGGPLFDLEFSGSNIKKILEDEDRVKQKLPGYRLRPSQVELSLRVGQSFKNGIHSLVQAPTGTGKTLGYLLPSTLFALNERKQVLISTGTKTLQEQAMTKDVPLLRKLLSLDGEKLKVSRLVGSSNHFCELMFRELSNESALMAKTLPFEESFSESFFEVLFQHNAQASSDEVILRDSLPFALKRMFPKMRELEKNCAVDFRSCSGQRCPYSENCSYIQGLREAKDADLVVGNHSLMFTWPASMPRPAHIVVDEAHKIEMEATSAYTFEVSEFDLKRLVEQLIHKQGIGALFYLLNEKEDTKEFAPKLVSELTEKINTTIEIVNEHFALLPEFIEQYFRSNTKFSDIYWNELPMIPETGHVDEVGRSVRNRLDSILNALDHLLVALVPYCSKWELKEMRSESEIVAFTKMEAFYRTFEDLLIALDSALSDADTHTQTIKYHSEEGFIISSAPIDVGRRLHDSLLSVSESTVFTSATLGNSTGNIGTKGIEWATGYSYLEPERRFRAGFYLPAVYDYKNKSQVFLCDDTPSLYDSSFVPSVLKPLTHLMKNIDGKSLLLFSAKSRFEQARELLLETFEGRLPLFIQGMGKNVVEDFKKEGRGILLGMESFGEGIDVPGETLQFVFIDKIPDLRMDKVVRDRQEFFDRSFGNAFWDYYLAHRTRALHQKLGRLLRTESDSGCAIIVDSRTQKWKGRTIEKFNTMMLPYHMKRASLKDACQQVESFILND